MARFAQMTFPDDMARAELLALMQRYNQSGVLLPRYVDEIDLDDLHLRTSLQLILVETTQVKAQIDTF
jgi:hypothetical protein